MAYRKSLVQKRFRLRKELLGRLEREAKRNDRSLNDEVEHILEGNFIKNDAWQDMLQGFEERNRQMMAMMDDLRSRLDPKAIRAALEPIKESAEQHPQNEVMKDSPPTKGGKS
jgi:hypothetical protein